MYANAEEEEEQQQHSERVLSPIFGSYGGRRREPIGEKRAQVASNKPQARPRRDAQRHIAAAFTCQAPLFTAALCIGPVGSLRLCASLHMPRDPQILL